MNLEEITPHQRALIFALYREEYERAQHNLTRLEERFAALDAEVRRLKTRLAGCVRKTATRKATT